MDEQNIVFETEDGQEVLFFVLEETTIGGVDYLLVTDDGEAEEAEAYVLRKVGEEEEEFTYEIVEDETELEAVSKIFEELLDDIEIK